MDPESAPDPEELLAQLSETRSSDGLPVIPPTDDRIDRMTGATSRDSQDVIFEIPATQAPLSVEALARCAVMAGCKPEYFPALIAAFEGLAEWDELRAAMATTSSYAIAAIVHGPAREEWNVNADTGLYGPGYRANATIGRAIHLTFIVVGEMIPGIGTMNTQSHPGRYTYCFGENEESSAWEPLHVTRGGLDAEESAVTVAAAQAPKVVSEGNVTTAPEDVLEAFAEGAAGAVATEVSTAEMIFVISSDHAQRLGETYTKSEVQEYIFENAKRSDGEQLLTSPADAIILTAGGIGNYSSVLPTWSTGTPPTTVPIEE